jgi:hypothetical protein
MANQKDEEKREEIGQIEELLSSSISRLIYKVASSPWTKFST